MSIHVQTSRSHLFSSGFALLLTLRSLPSQFCDIISSPSVCRWAGPIIDVLLDYVGNVQLCSKLTEHLDSYEHWVHIKEKSG